MKKVLKIVAISFLIIVCYMSAIGTPKNIYWFDKLFINTFALSFIVSHFIFGPKKVWNYIIDNRYKIAVVFLIVCTLLQYSGSSNGVITEYVYEPENSNMLFGIPCFIHSDEYALETMIAVAQKNNDFKQYLNTLRGTNTDLLSIIHAPIKDVLILGKLFNLGYLILSPGMGLAFYWNLRLIAFLLITFELFLIITNKNKKVSAVATICLVFSGVCNWFTWASEILLWGEAAIVLLDKFMTSNNYKVKMPCIFGIAICAISYIFTEYPAWMISFGYIFLALAIWIIIKNFKEYKFKVIDLGLIGLAILFVGIMCYRYYSLAEKTINIIANTSYPGARIEKGGNGIPYLFSYLYNFLLPFVITADNCSVASIISIFPVPMLMAIYYMYKKEKNISFLMPITIVAVLETIFCISGFPEIISKITLFKYVIVERASVAVGIANFYILIYMLANIQDTLLSMKVMIRGTIILMCTLVFVPFPTEMSSKLYLSLFAGILCLLTFLFLNNGDKRYRNVLMVFMIVLTITGAICVNPITKGVYAITDINIAKEMQKVVAENSNALWISYDDTMLLANYLVANGAKTINSTNIYPNEEFYRNVLGDEKLEEKREIWNRYAHVIIELSEENDVELKDKDKVILYITPEKLKEQNIKYIVTKSEKSEFEEYGVNVEVLYKKDKVENKYNAEDEHNAIYIYQVK